jgi:hypothetical protein
MPPLKEKAEKLIFPTTNASLLMSRLMKLGKRLKLRMFSTYFKKLSRIASISKTSSKLVTRIMDSSNQMKNSK